MTRNQFGGTTADEVYGLVKVNGQSVESPTGATVLFYDAQTGGNQITDLQDSGGAPITSVTADSTGMMPVFFGPDGVTQMWASANGGPRRMIVSFAAAASAVSSAQTSATSAAASASAAASSASTAQTAASQATAPTDTTMAAKIQDSTSQTAQALATAYASVVAATTLTDAGIVAAAAKVQPGGQVYLLPGKTYTISNPITLTDVGLRGDGSAILNVPTALGAGVAAVTITSSQTNAPIVTLEGFQLTGPGPRSLGVKTANCDGLAVTGSAKPIVSHVRITQFDSGNVWNNTVGHIYLDHSEVTDCYYGIYCKQNTYDYFVTDCRIDGNTFANFATPADQGFAGMVVQNTHAGFAPYGIYQEATPANQGSPKVFLQDVILQHTRFEAIGNGAIFTDAQQDASNASITSNLHVEHPGFSWSATYKIATRAQDYAVTLSQTDRIIHIAGGANPFTAGAVNVYHVKTAGHASLELHGASAATTQVVTDSIPLGSANVFAWSAPAVPGAQVSFQRVTVAGDGTNAFLNFGTATNRYAQFNGSTARVGGDASNVVYADGSEFRVRASDNGYGIVFRATKAGVGFNNAAPSKPVLSYSRSGAGETAAAAAIRSALATLGLVTDSTTA